MEENRLKPMKEGYDEELFNSLYHQTSKLRRSLAYQIDARRYGVDYEDILSWFDIKFIHAFNRYFGEKEPDILKAYIINSLGFFKNRILRYGYSLKNQVNNTIDISEASKLKGINIEYSQTDEELFLELALSFLKKTLSKEAYQVLELELYPPLYIIKRVGTNKSAYAKIPNQLICEYFGWEFKTKALQYVSNLRKEIQEGILLAKQELAY